MLMKKIYLFLAVILAVFAFAGCNKMSTEKKLIENDRVCGSSEFISSIRALHLTQTKAGELNAEELSATIAPLFPIAKEYLLVNGYDYSEDFTEEDPNLILTALSLYQYDISMAIQTKATLTQVLGCIALGGDLGGLAAGGVKYVAKQLAKKVVERAVPYVGVVVTIVSASICLGELDPV